MGKIYYFIGQSGSGKTTLSNMLNDFLKEESVQIDGDDMREIFKNKDYSPLGRRKNILLAHNITKDLINNKTVILSLVSPFRDLRDELKSTFNVVEVFLNTTEDRGKNNYHVDYFEKPKDNYIEIDTTNKNPNESFIELLGKINDMILKEDILKVCKCNVKNLDKHFCSLKATLSKFNINTKERIAAFLANIIHETGGLKSLEENLNYSEKGLLATFPSRITSEEAKILARKPELIANKVYGNRYGNVDEGDGWKYRGRGIFQVTFKKNYENIGKKLEIDLLSNPDLLLEPPYAALSAGIYWDEKKLNLLADKKDFHGVVKKINGGLNGIEDRLKYYNKFLEIL